jgi:hypothetical protein
VITQQAIGEYIQYILGIFLEGFYEECVVSWAFENLLTINSSIVNVVIATFFKFYSVSHHARLLCTPARKKVIFLF